MAEKKQKKTCDASVGRSNNEFEYEFKFSFFKVDLNSNELAFELKIKIKMNGFNFALNIVEHVSVSNIVD